MDRYSITKGMYNLFDQCIRVKNLADTPVFYHEYYHHIQNVSTVLGGERLNLLMQFLAHATNLASSHTPLKAPFNRWYEEGLKSGFTDLTLQRRLENLVLHQDEWMYLDKINYKIHFFNKRECYDENIATLPNEEKGALEPYIVKEENGLFVGYPVGGFTITESGAYALELWHSQQFDPNILNSLNEQNYQYLIVLDLIYKLIGDFRMSCLATFLFCDLAMIISTPSIGFLAIYQTAKLVLEKGITEEALLKWYEHTYYTFREEIKENISLEIGIITDIRSKKNGLNDHIENMIEWQLNIMERGLKVRLNNKLEFTKRLLSKSQEDLNYLMIHFPPTIIETTDNGKIHCGSEEDVNNYEMLNASYNLYLGLCRDVNFLLKHKDIIHTKQLSKQEFIFELKRDGDNSDAYGYMLHTMGLIGKPITILN